MSGVLIPSTKSLTVTDKFPNKNFNKDIIVIGSDGKYRYISYLYFDITAIPNDTKVTNAELVLFRTNNFFDKGKEEFYIAPLVDYFSNYSTFNNYPKAETDMKKKFNPLNSKVAVVIDLTKLVSLWVNNKLRNTGIALFNKKGCILAEFGSAISSNSYIIPFINVNIEPAVKKCNCCTDFNCNCHIPTTRKIKVIGTVAPASKYDAIVNIAVKRSDCGNTDNYYVSDEYDNSLSGTPMIIDKTYNMAIIPKEKSGDKETISFFGSYKE